MEKIQGRTTAIHALVADDSGVMPAGMGAGRVTMKESGFHTLSPDEASCVVYGMPGEAIKIGALGQVLDLSNIYRGIIRALEGINKCHNPAAKGGSL
jgi:two-component system chemotaxis response regulator CheB